MGHHSGVAWRKVVDGAGYGSRPAQEVSCYPFTRGQGVEEWSEWMLLGEFTHTLDAKGRVFLPAKWRDELAGGVVVTAGQERCLFVMTREVFARRAAQLEQLSSDHKASRDYKRMFFSSASEESVDKTGRMTIPAGLRSFAGLEGKEVVLIGVSDRAEVWDKESWDRYRASVEEAYAQVAEEL